MANKRAGALDDWFRDLLLVDNGDGSFSLSTNAGSSSVTQGALTNRSGTITTGGAAQQLAAANANRRYLIVQNHSTGVLWLEFGGTAVVGQPSLALSACAVANDGTGGALVFEGSFVPTGSVSILGATTGQAFSSREA